MIIYNIFLYSYWRGLIAPPLPRGSRYARYTRYSPHVSSKGSLCFRRITQPSVFEVFAVIAAHWFLHTALNGLDAERRKHPG